MKNKNKHQQLYINVNKEILFIIKMIVFIFFTIVLIIMTFLYHIDYRIIHYIHSTYNRLFIETDKYGFILKSYFQTIFIVVLINLLMSLFNFDNFIYYNEPKHFFYILSIFNLILFLILGIRKNGFHAILNSLYQKLGNSKFFIPISLFVSILQIFLNYILKPIVLPARLTINTMIGIKMHHEISKIKYSFILLTIISCLKIMIFFIQSYIFLIFTIEMFKHLYDLE